MSISLAHYETMIGKLSRVALERGGEALLDRITAELGVASRHLARIHAGELTLTPAVREEIDASIARARELLGD